ncbi:MAK10-like protein [Tanacetum coccineum]|uniref:MAK10-like protein n=1 Tax=Tanacetum coccineum TaxID=301880 RepID=A0ABQ5JDL0_9ASTR
MKNVKNVLLDECNLIKVEDASTVVMVNVKEIDTISNMYHVCRNEGFDDTKFHHIEKEVEKTPPKDPNVDDSKPSGFEKGPIYNNDDVTSRAGNEDVSFTTDQEALIDLPMGGQHFTWMNKVGSNMSKLDRFLILDDVLHSNTDLNVNALDRLCIWKEFGGNTRDLAQFRKKRDKIATLHEDDDELAYRSIFTWEDLTTRFLAQFYPPGRTAKLQNDIFMFQQHQGESLSEAWTHFKDVIQKVPHHGIDLWLQNDPKDFAKLVKEISLPCDVPNSFDHHLIELENQVQRLMKAHLAPKTSV